MTCLRGASAVEELLREVNHPNLRVFAIWEPVLATDLSAPSSATLKRISDKRAAQFWDKGRLLSRALGEKDADTIVWDRILIYERGQLWQDSPPKAFFEDGPVVNIIEGARGALKNITERKLNVP